MHSLGLIWCFGFFLMLVIVSLSPAGQIFLFRPPCWHRTFTAQETRLLSSVLFLMSELRINFSYFSSKPYIVTPHLNRLAQDGSDERSPCMFLCIINKNYPELSPDTPTYLELCKVL